MDFLEKIYLDNTIGQWLTVAGVILLALLLKKYVSRYLASLLYRMVYKTWKSVDKKSFVDLLLAPLQWFVLTLIAVFSIDKLNFPSALFFNLYRINTQLIFERTGITVIVLVFTWLQLRLIDFISLVLESKASLTEDKSDDQLIVFFRDFLKVILGIIGFLLLLKFTFGQNIGNLLTGLSIVGAALALAAKESLENIIASFIIFFDKPFKTGDDLTIQSITGNVERIGLRSTKIRTADKTLVSVPNKQMVDSIVDNLSMRTERRDSIIIELSQKTNSSDVKKAIETIKSNLQQLSPALISNAVYLKEITKTGLQIHIEYLTSITPVVQIESLKQNIQLQIKEILEELKIELSFAADKVN
ncbi:MAG: mechanosensitive ion channel protein MscS [Chitinophagaceae bacterium]|nr:MAG: mechanosensitive ion channel protein MscS [Chitinophagaceae bacterium]